MDYEFRQGNLMMVPYDPQAGYDEDPLMPVYQRLRAEGLWTTVFHENPDMSLLQFLTFFSGPRNLLQIYVLVDGDRMVDMVAIGWLADITICQKILTKGMGSFCYFRDYQKPAFTDQIGRMGLSYWFEKLKMDMIVGVTPASNRAALLYAKRMGFHECGRIPGYTTLDHEVVDGVITSMSRSEFMGGNHGERPS